MPALDGRGLRVLALGENPWVALPSSIGELAELTELYVPECGLEAVPASLGGLTGLRILDLGHNRLRVVPGLGALVDLEVLYLHDNRLAVLPSLPGGLTYLNVSENPLGRLPEAVGRLSSLVELRALDASLVALPPLSGLRALRELHLRGNRLASLPALHGLGELRHLDLRENALTVLPDSIGALRSLRVLDLRANALTALPAAVGALPALEKLDLRWNSFEHPPAVPAGLRERGCVVLT